MQFLQLLVKETSSEVVFSALLCSGCEHITCVFLHRILWRRERKNPRKHRRASRSGLLLVLKRITAETEVVYPSSQWSLRSLWGGFFLTSDRRVVANCSQQQYLPWFRLIFRGKPLLCLKLGTYLESRQLLTPHRSFHSGFKCVVVCPGGDLHAYKSHVRLILPYLSASSSV